MNNELPKNYKARFLLDLYMSNTLGAMVGDNEVTDSPEFARGEEYNMRKLEYRIDDLLMIFTLWMVEHPEWTEELFLRERGDLIERCKEDIKSHLESIRMNRMWYHDYERQGKREKVEGQMKKNHEKIIDIDLPMHPSHLETMRWEMLGRKKAKNGKKQ